YKAIYSALDGKEYDKTLDKLSTWSISDTSLASASSKGKFVGKKVGTTTIKVDYGSLSATATLKVVAADPPPEPEPEPEPLPNNPPTASVFTAPMYYWPEVVEFHDYSFDHDGVIISRDLKVDGQSSGFTRNFPRVTQEETHNVTLTVTDDDGESDTDSRSFRILPTTPKALFQTSGTLKQNRKVTFDAHVSDQATPATKVAPINYNLTTWTITPKTAGLSAADIKIDNSVDGGKRDVLLKSWRI
ncbi:hypothetical protein E4O93_03460, partial [Diaphorobacter sp. DS2]